MDLYGTRLYGEEDCSEQLDLLKYLPEFWHSIIEMCGIQNSISPEIAQIKSKLNDILNQCFVSTATWGLDMWEQELGITTNTDISFEERRAAIMSKLFGTATTTIAMIKQLTDSITGGVSVIAEDNVNYRFIVHFKSPYGIPNNIPALKAALEVCKPAHLGYVLIYTYATWGEIKRITWGTARTMTWDKIKICEVDKI